VGVIWDYIGLYGVIPGVLGFHRGLKGYMRLFRIKLGYIG